MIHNLIRIKSNKDPKYSCTWILVDDNGKELNRTKVTSDICYSTTNQIKSDRRRICKLFNIRFEDTRLMYFTNNEISLDCDINTILNSEIYGPRFKALLNRTIKVSEPNISDNKEYMRKCKWKDGDYNKWLEQQKKLVQDLTVPSTQACNPTDTDATEWIKNREYLDCLSKSNPYIYLKKDEEDYIDDILYDRE